ncbi:MAG: Gfo/Idh/MocA family oxidoreductase [Bacteroidota bacterium]
MNSKNSKLKVGIAGYGIIGKRRRTFIDSNPHFKTVAVSDIKYKGEGIFPDGTKFYSDFRLLINQEIDVLFVCLPNYLAAEATILGLKNRLHVFCEKPPAKDVDEVLKILKVKKHYPTLKLKYGFNHRYHDSYVEAAKIVKSKKYGNLKNIRGVYGKSRMVTFEGGWRSHRNYAGGGILLDQGIHMLDMISTLAGDFDEIHSFISNDFWKHDVEDNAYVMMRNKSGCVAMIHSTATQWQHRFRLELTLDKALIELSGILSGSKSYGEERLKIIPRNIESNNGAFDEISKIFLDDLSWKREIDEFSDVIINNKKVVNGSPEDALKIMKLIQKIYFSDKKWRDNYHIVLPNNKQR